MVVQEYLNKPLLWDGYKIDLRIYVLVTNCDPLRIFLYQDGLVRLSTEKYSSASEKNLVTINFKLSIRCIVFQLNLFYKMFVYSVQL